MNSSKITNSPLHVGLFATARPITRQELTPFLDFLKKNSVKISFAENLFTFFHQFAGTDKQRIRSFEKLLQEDPEVFWAVRGGYGSTRIIDDLPWDLLAKKRPVLVGYSDITALLIEAIRRNIPVLHAPMPVNFSEKFKQSEESFEKTLHFLQTGKLSYSFPSNLREETSLTTKIIGGNLSMLVHLIGTPTLRNFPWEEFSLFLEDIEEYYYAIDRMFVQLKRSGIPEKVQAVLLGEFTKTQDNEIPFGFSIREMLQEKIPNKIIIDGFPVGHGKENFPLPLNRKVQIQRNSEGLVTFSVV